MAQSQLFVLHSVATIVTATTHNPSILGADFLRINGIVPQDWNADQTIVTPTTTLVKFGDVAIQVDKNRLTISEALDGEFRDEYEIHSIAQRYVETLRHVPYQSIVLNCKVSLKRANPEKWLKERFLKAANWMESPRRLARAHLTLVFDADSAKCNLEFSPGNARTNQSEEHYRAVIIDCNFHHEGPHQIDEMLEILQSWPRRQEEVLSLLRAVLTRRLQ